MIKLSKERLRAALPRLTLAEQDEILTLMEQERVEVETAAERWAELEATRTPLESFMPPGASEYVAAHPMSWPAGERPPIAEFIASFAPAMPAKPNPETKATIASTPDIATRVPPGRRGKLLDDVLARTMEEMRRAPQATDDVDRLRPYRGGRVDLDGGGFTDE